MPCTCMDSSHQPLASLDDTASFIKSDCSQRPEGKLFAESKLGRVRFRGTFCLSLSTWGAQDNVHLQLDPNPLKEGAAYWEKSGILMGLPRKFQEWLCNSHELCFSEHPSQSPSLHLPLLERQENEKLISLALS